MAKGNSPNGLNNGQNTVRRSVTISSQLAQTTNRLFSVLKGKNSKTAFEFSEDLEVDLDWRNGNGLLQAMANPEHRICKDVKFEEIKGESLYLYELEKIFTNKVSGLSHSTLRKNFEVVFVEKARKELVNLMGSGDKTKALKSDFLAYVSSCTTPAEFLASVASFGHNINDKEQKKAFHSLINEYKLSFFAIQQGLEQKGEDCSSLSMPFSQWNKEHQIFWDAILTQSVIGRTQDRVKEMSDLIEETGNLFNKVLPGLNAIFKKYPFKYKDLQQKYPQEWARITQLQSQIVDGISDEQWEAIHQEIHRIELDLYLKDIQKEDTELADAIKHLIEEDGDYSKLSSQDFSRLMKELVEDSLTKMKDKNLTKLFDHYHVSDFENFFRNVYDLGQNKLKIGDVELNINKHIAQGSGRNVQSLEDLGKMDQPPLVFEISGLEKNHFSLENYQMLEGLFKGKIQDGKLTLTGNDIGKLFFLYLAVEGKQSFDEIERLKQRKADFAKLFDTGEGEIDTLKQALNSESKEGGTGQIDSSSEKKDGVSENKEGTGYQEVVKFWKEKVKGENSDDPDGGFREGAVLYFDLNEMESLVPPFNEGSMEKIRMEITKVDQASGEVSFKCFGTEMNLSKSQEGVEMTKSFDQLNTMLGKLDTNTVFKILPGKSDVNQIFGAMNAAGYGPNNLGNIQIKNGKMLFVGLDEKGNEIEQEATHFSVMDEMPDDKSGIRNSRILYQTTLNSDGTVTVNGEVPDMDGEIKVYKRTMILSDFLLFIANKKLQPKTEQQAKAEQITIKNLEKKDQKGWKWLTIRGLTSGVKSVWGTLKKKVDEYYKDQDDAALAWLINDFAVYDKIAKVAGISSAVSWASAALRDEAVAKQESLAWAPIEKWVGKFEKMVDFPTFFKTGKDDFTGLQQSDLGGKTLMQVLESGKTVANDPKWRAIMAAALIANLKKGAGMYRNVQGGENKALWVKCLLGDELHRDYMKKRADDIARIKAGALDADQIQDRLKTSELDYIINNISGANMGQQYGCLSDPNKTLRRMYSTSFSKALGDARINTDTNITETYNNIKHQNFNQAFADFKALIKSGRFERGIANLMKMADLTGKDSTRFAQVQKAFTFVVLSGMMNRYGGDKKTRKMFDQLAVTLQIPTALGTKKRGHRDDAWHLMDKIPPAPGQKKFSEFLAEKKLKKSDFGVDSPHMDYNGLIDALWIWWGANAQQVDEYFDSLFLPRHDADGNIQKLDSVEQAVHKQLRKKESDNVYANWAGNPALMSIKGLQKGAEVFRTNMSYDKDGFRGDNADVRNDKAAFRNDLTKDLSERTKYMAPDDMMGLFLKIFGNAGFSESHYPKIVSYIRTARRVKNYGVGRDLRVPLDTSGTNSVSTGSYVGNEANVILDYLFRGEILKLKGYPPVEFERFIQVFVSYFQKHLDKFDDAMLEKIFGEKVLEDKDSSPKILIPWEEYNKYKVKDFMEDEEDKQEKKSEEGKKKQSMYNDEARILNKKLVETERQLQRMGVKTSSLSGFSQDKVGSFVDQVYGQAA